MMYYSHGNWDSLGPLAVSTGWPRTIFLSPDSEFPIPPDFRPRAQLWAGHGHIERLTLFLTISKY